MSSSLPPQNRSADLFSHAAALNNDASRKPERSADTPSKLIPLYDTLQDDLVGDRLLTDRAVADLFSVSRQTVWRWARSNDHFPKPVQISPGASRWRLIEIRSFITSLGVESHKEEAK